MVKKILLSMGTRPEIIKMAPVYHELVTRGIKPVVLHTGQHHEMAQSLYELFGITPDYNLAGHTKETTSKKHCELALQSSHLLAHISATMLEINPDMVLVHGDTSSAFMAALAAFYQQRPIAHIEAGLRSHEAYNPFPEEKNRVLVAQLSHWHFAPTQRAKDNLLKEGIAESRIHVVGNTVVDATRLGINKFHEAYNHKKHDFIDTISHQITDKKLIVVTMHRRENHGSNIESIAHSLAKLLELYPEYVMVLPVHPNPKVKHALHAFYDQLPASIQQRLHLTEPLDYPILLWLLENAWLVLTDSGGIQEEAISLHTPVLVLRDTTERPEIIEAGAGILVGTKQDTILSHIETLHKDEKCYQAMRNAKNPFGDGTTSAKICDILLASWNPDVDNALVVLEK